MNKQEMEESVLPSPLLPRLDRHDRLLQLLEEKHNLSSSHLSKPTIQKLVKQEDDQWKTLSTALDEVQRKGTLMERLTMLENRVLQLSLGMDEGNTSKSSSSTVPGSEKLDHGFTSSTGSGRQDENEVVTLQGGQIPVAVREEDRSQDRDRDRDRDRDSTGIACDAKKKGRKNDRRQRKKGYKKWLGWFDLGCN